MAILAILLDAVSAQATFPGKNGAIAFSHLQGPTNAHTDDFEIRTIVPGRAARALPHQGGHKDNWPDWSPDGRRIVWWQMLDGALDVWVMNADGSNQVNLTSENPGRDANAAWSPDGTEIVLDSSYRTDSGDTEIQVMDAGGQSFRQLTHGAPGADGFGQFSPDGKRIAFASSRSGHWAIYTMDAKDGGNVQKLTPDSLMACVPDWSPDGRSIAFFDSFCDSCGASDLWVVEANGERLRRLTNTPLENEFRPCWSPDGKKLTFASIPSPFTGPADLYVMNANGRRRRNITRTPGLNERAPDWGSEKR